MEQRTMYVVTTDITDIHCTVYVLVLLLCKLVPNVLHELGSGTWNPLFPPLTSPPPAHPLEAFPGDDRELSPCDFCFSLPRVVTQRGIQRERGEGQREGGEKEREKRRYGLGKHWCVFFQRYFRLSFSFTPFLSPLSFFNPCSVSSFLFTCFWSTLSASYPPFFIFLLPVSCLLLFSYPFLISSYLLLPSSFFLLLASCFLFVSFFHPLLYPLSFSFMFLISSFFL